MLAWSGMRLRSANRRERLQWVEIRRGVAEAAMGGPGSVVFQAL